MKGINPSFRSNKAINFSSFKQPGILKLKRMKAGFYYKKYFHWYVPETSGENKMHVYSNLIKLEFPFVLLFSIRQISKTEELIEVVIPDVIIKCLFNSLVDL